MKYIKMFENFDFLDSSIREEYEKYIGKFSIVTFIGDNKYSFYIFKILDIYQKTKSSIPYLEIIEKNDYNNKYGIPIKNIDILETYDTLEEAEYNLELMKARNKYNI